MNTLCLPPTEDALNTAAALLRSGGLVAFPTETVYGLGANALDEAAVQSIFEAKQRPQDNPLIVHIAKAEAAQALCHVDERARRLMAAFFPGPLTLLMRKKPLVPQITTAGLNSVGIRMPAHPAALALIQRAGIPIAAPSANRSGKPSPTEAAHVFHDLGGRIPFILDGGSCEVGVESTVLDITGDVPMVLRPGGVTVERLKDFLPDVQVADSVFRALLTGEAALSPGMRYTHYAPQGALTLVEGEREEVLCALNHCFDAQTAQGFSVCLMAFDEDIPFFKQRRHLSFGSRKYPEQAAARLFSLLRQMDDENVDFIYSVAIDTKGLGLAVMNRLGRAAGFHFLSAKDVLR